MPSSQTPFEARMREKAEQLKHKEHVRILALETSCDETAAAVIEDGRNILSNIVFSQIDLHALYGGVVPEIASRAHVEACDRVVDEAAAAKYPPVEMDFSWLYPRLQDGTAVRP